MLTAEENQLLCRVEGDAPMGQLMRRHWIPVCMAEEVAENDGTPIRARLLGEDLVVFRDSEGRLGVLDEATAEANESGENAHHLYKERQRAIVQKRLKKGGRWRRAGRT